MTAVFDNSMTLHVSWLDPRTLEVTRDVSPAGRSVCAADVSIFGKWVIGIYERQATEAPAASTALVVYGVLDLSSGNVIVARRASAVEILQDPAE